MLMNFCFGSNCSRLCFFFFGSKNLPNITVLGILLLLRICLRQISWNIFLVVLVVIFIFIFFLNTCRVAISIVRRYFFLSAVISLLFCHYFIFFPFFFRISSCFPIFVCCTLRPSAIMDPRYLEDDEVRIEMDIRGIDPTDPSALCTLVSWLNEELIGSRESPSELHSSFKSVTGEVAEISWKLASLVVKSGDPIDLSRSQHRLLHLVGRVVRLESRSGGHAQVARLREELDARIDQMSTWIENSEAQAAANSAVYAKEAAPRIDAIGEMDGASATGPSAPVVDPKQPSGLSVPSTQSNLDNSFSALPLPPLKSTSVAGPSTAGMRQRLASLVAPPQNPFAHPRMSQQFNNPVAEGVVEGGQPRNYRPSQASHGWSLEKWPLRFLGSPKDLPIDEFIFRVETLARLSDLTEAAMTLGLHQLLVGSAASWYWVFIRNEPNASWRRIKAALSEAFRSNVSDAAIRRAIMDRLQRPGERFVEFLLAIRELEVRLAVRFTEAELLETLRRNMLPTTQHRLLFVYPRSVPELQRYVQDLEELAQNQLEVQQLRKVAGRVHEFSGFVPPLDNSYVAPGYAPIYPELNNQSYPPTWFAPDSAYDPVAIPTNPVGTLENTYSTPSQPDWLCAMANPSDRNTAILCWNCEERGHTFVDCLAPRNIFCYGCGLKNTVRPQCPKCAPRALQGNGWRSARPPPGLAPARPALPGPALRPLEQPRRQQ